MAEGLLNKGVRREVVESGGLLSCQNCKNIPSEAYICSKCRTKLCRECIYADSNNPITICPKCNDQQAIFIIDEIFTAIANSVETDCRQGCGGSFLGFESHRKHQKECTMRPYQCPLQSLKNCGEENFDTETGNNFDIVLLLIKKYQIHHLHDHHSHTIIIMMIL